MSSPWDDVRKESLEMPAVGRQARPSPLPWMLLTVSIVMTIGVLILGRSRLEDERLRTATALKANDEVKGQLKTAIDDLDQSRAACTAADESTSELQKKILTLELELMKLRGAAKGPKK